jgi:plasmid maintenance system antidote protein VapI
VSANSYSIDRFTTDAQIEAERLFLIRDLMRLEPEAISNREIASALKAYDQTVRKLVIGASDLQSKLADLLSENSLQIWGNGLCQADLAHLRAACDALKLAFVRCAVRDWKHISAAYEFSKRDYGASRPNLEAPVAALEELFEVKDRVGDLGDRLVRVAKKLRGPFDTGDYPRNWSRELVLSLAGPLADLLALETGASPQAEACGSMAGALSGQLAA